jgi:hypothetical protein
MSETTNPVSPPSVPPYEDVKTAPIINFDVAPAYGVMGGIVQIELAGRILIPSNDDSVQARFIAIARLRCSQIAANNLRSAIDAALKMMEQPQQSTAAAVSTLN